MAESRKCPECGERLSFDALRCACGWGARRVGKGDKAWDHRCTFKAGEDRCEYPVGLFAEGATSGWCIFHRHNPHEGSEIIRQSKFISYREAIRPIQAKDASSPAVVDTAWDIAKRHGSKPWQESVAEFIPAILKRGAA